MQLYEINAKVDALAARIAALEAERKPAEPVKAPELVNAPSSSTPELVAAPAPAKV